MVRERLINESTDHPIAYSNIEMPRPNNERDPRKPSCHTANPGVPRTVRIQNVGLEAPQPDGAMQNGPGIVEPIGTEWLHADAEFGSLPKDPAASESQKRDDAATLLEAGQFRQDPPLFSSRLG
jgi:hypothetical protein